MGGCDKLFRNEAVVDETDLARRALLPCLVAASSAYVTYVVLIGT